MPRARITCAGRAACVRRWLVLIQGRNSRGIWKVRILIASTRMVEVRVRVHWIKSLRRVASIGGFTLAEGSLFCFVLSCFCFLVRGLLREGCLFYVVCFCFVDVNLCIVYS